MARRATWLKVLLFRQTRQELPLGKRMLLSLFTRLEMIGMLVIVIFSYLLDYFIVCKCILLLFIYFLSFAT